MSKSLELPDGVYDQLLEVAQTSGTTPANWVAAQVADTVQKATGNGGPRPATLGEILTKIGVHRSGRPTNASERVKELFGEHLVQKRKEGR